MRKIQPMVLGVLLCASAAVHAAASAPVPVQAPDSVSRPVPAQEVKQEAGARRDAQGRPAQPRAVEAGKPLPDASKRDAARPR